MQLAKTYQLDPFAKQIWAVKYGNNPAAIFAGRDGFLAIAHRSGKFDGMESGTRQDESGDLIGWCKVYRKDMAHPFEVAVPLAEYSTGKNLWQSKPKTMIIKVAESHALRRAFGISGLYSPEEIDTGDRPEPRIVTEIPRRDSDNLRGLRDTRACGDPGQDEAAHPENPVRRVLHEVVERAPGGGVDVGTVAHPEPGHQQSDDVHRRSAEGSI